MVVAANSIAANTALPLAGAAAAASHRQSRNSRGGRSAARGGIGGDGGAEGRHLHPLHLHRTLYGHHLRLLVLGACCERRETELPFWWWLFSIPLSISLAAGAHSTTERAPLRPSLCPLHPPRQDLDLTSTLQPLATGRAKAFFIKSPALTEGIDF